MKNPLDQYFEIEERSDGVYLKVNPSQRASVGWDLIFRTLAQSTIVNLDISRIRGVYQKASDVFEKIGPPFEYFDPELQRYLQLNVTPLSASMRISSACIAAGKKPTDKILRYFLSLNKVNTGIDSGKISDLLSEDNFGKLFEVAKGMAPQKGEDARIELRFESENQIRPQLKDDGSVDFRDIHRFISVSAGQVIAEKIPAQPGKPGKTVSGELIAAEPGNDVGFPEAKNTGISQDGRYLVSTINGVLFQENGQLHVKELLQVEANVDFSVGNIKYTGEVLIQGDVLPGFVVESEGNIHIKGELESSRVISRNGFVIVEKGIIGKGSTFVSGKKGIQAGFAQDANLETEGTLVVEKFLLHCDCICRKLEVNGSHSAVVGSRINAEEQMTLRNAGNEQDSSLRLNLFDRHKTAIQKKLKELSVLENKLAVELEVVQKQLRSRSAIVKKIGEDISWRMREEIKKWVDAYNTLTHKIKYVKLKQEQLENELNKPVNYQGFIKITGNIFPGTVIDLYGKKMVINQVFVNKRFHLNPKGSISQE